MALSPPGEKPYALAMTDPVPTQLRRGWTTGACATAATKAALQALWGGAFPRDVTITLPKGEKPVFPLAFTAAGPGWAEVGITKDAGDDPDVTHGALIRARVRATEGGVSFVAGEGVGTVTRPGLPIGVGEPAINPVPRQLMTDIVTETARSFAQKPDVEITITVPGGAALAAKTWNPRLGIVGGISILGTTGVVRPFSCAAWIASIHRGVDVARASGLRHVAGCTGATSEAAVQGLFDLPDHAMMDMGDFAGGLIKYVRDHPVPRLTIGGGIAKMTKLAQGKRDLHSARSVVDFAELSSWAEAVGLPPVAEVNSVLEAYEIAGDPLAVVIAENALRTVAAMLRGAPVVPDIVIVSRTGEVIARAAKA